MAIADYSTTPSSNTAIAGINIDENCPPANLNNALRQLMADIKTLLGSVSPAEVATLDGLTASTAELNKLDGVTDFAATVFDDADAATARTTLGAPALPKTSTGAGQWTLVYAAANASIALPAGGQWTWTLFKRATPGGTINAILAGIDAGGTVLSAGAAGQDMYAVCWRANG